MVNISYSVSFTDDTTPAPPPKLWAFCGVEMIPAPDEAVLLRRQDDDRRHFVRRDVAAVLNACQHFQTLEVHARNAGEVIPELKGQPEHALPVLSQLADSGFLRSADEILERLSDSNECSELPLTPPRAFIITCDRPVALRRLLASLAEKPHGCGSITVIDDSRDVVNQRDNETAVREAAARGFPTLEYFGQAARQKLLSDLSAKIPDHEQSIRFLCDRESWPNLPTYGQARNLALLLSVGERALVLDDDILVKAYAPKNSAPHLRFAEVNERRVTFFEDRKSMFEVAHPLEDSPLPLSANVLGKPLSELIRSYSARAQSLQGAHAPDWWRPRSNHVISTQCGTWGDPGTGEKAHWIINLKPEDLEGLLAHGDSMMAVLSCRAAWMGYPTPMAMRFGAMSAVTGLDHRSLLPPYVPALRGEDFLFGVMLEKIAPESVVMGLPWGVPHLPVDKRNEVTFEGTTAARASLRSLALWLDKQPITGVDRTSRLRHLSQSVKQLSQSTPEWSLDEMLNELTQQHIQQLNQITKAQAATTGSNNSIWHVYLQQAHKELLETLGKPLDTSTMLNTGTDNTDAKLRLLMSNGQQLADALDAWPTICAAAREIM